MFDILVVHKKLKERNRFIQEEHQKELPDDVKTILKNIVFSYISRRQPIFYNGNHTPEDNVAEYYTKILNSLVTQATDYIFTTQKQRALRTIQRIYPDWNTFYKSEDNRRQVYNPLENIGYYIKSAFHNVCRFNMIDIVINLVAKKELILSLQNASHSIIKIHAEGTLDERLDKFISKRLVSGIKAYDKDVIDELTQKIKAYYLHYQVYTAHNMFEKRGKPLPEKFVLLPYVVSISTKGFLVKEWLMSFIDENGALITGIYKGLSIWNGKKFIMTKMTFSAQHIFEKMNKYPAVIQPLKVKASLDYEGDNKVSDKKISPALKKRIVNVMETRKKQTMGYMSYMFSSETKKIMDPEIYTFLNSTFGLHVHFNVDDYNYCNDKTYGAKRRQAMQAYPLLFNIINKIIYEKYTIITLKGESLHRKRVDAKKKEYADLYQAIDNDLPLASVLEKYNIKGKFLRKMMTYKPHRTGRFFLQTLTKHMLMKSYMLSYLTKKHIPENRKMCQEIERQVVAFERLPFKPLLITYNKNVNKYIEYILQSGNIVDKVTDLSDMLGFFNTYIINMLYKEDRNLYIKKYAAYLLLYGENGTIESALSRSDEWHEQRHHDFRQQLIFMSNNVETTQQAHTTWEPLANDFHVKIDNEDCSMSFLTSEAALVKEGNNMRHCVGGYGYQCLYGNCHIAHVTGSDNSSSTVELKIQDNKITVVQNRTLNNHKPSESCQMVVAKFIEATSKNKKMIDYEHIAECVKQRLEDDEIFLRSRFNQIDYYNEEVGDYILRYIQPYIPKSFRGMDWDAMREQIQKSFNKNNVRSLFSTKKDIDLTFF